MVNTGIISIHAKFFRKQNMEMFSSNLNGKRRRQKTGIIAMLSPKTEDPLFGQQCCGYSQKTVLAQKGVSQHYQCQLHSIAFSFWLRISVCLGEGKRQEGGRIWQVFFFISTMSFLVSKWEYAQISSSFCNSKYWENQRCDSYYNMTEHSYYSAYLKSREEKIWFNETLSMLMFNF